jgi:hypothetical protein
MTPDLRSLLDYRQLSTPSAIMQSVAAMLAHKG